MFLECFSLVSFVIRILKERKVYYKLIKVENVIGFTVSIRKGTYRQSGNSKAVSITLLKKRLLVQLWNVRNYFWFGLDPHCYKLINCSLKSRTH